MVTLDPVALTACTVLLASVSMIACVVTVTSPTDVFTQLKRTASPSSFSMETSLVSQSTAVTEWLPPPRMISSLRILIPFRVTSPSPTPLPMITLS